MGILSSAWKRPLVSIFGACALCSVLSIHVASDFAVQDLDDYARDNNIPTEVFDGLPYKENTKVYKKNLAGFFYDAGVSSYRMTKALSHEFFEEEEDGAWRTAISVPLIAAVYPVRVTMQLATNIYVGVKDYDINAYALPGYTGGGDCVINPPNQMSMNEFMHQFTDIPKAHLSKFSDNVSPIIPIMAHEAKHCELILSKTMKERSLKSFTLGGEARADNYYMEKHDSLYPDSDLDKIFLYTRAVSLLSRDHFDGGHATSLNVDALLQGTEAPKREAAYHNYSHLNELVKKELLDFKADGEDEDGEYYQAVYGAVQKLLEGDELTPLMRRAAELYIEGVEYIADKSPLFDAPKVGMDNKAKNLPVFAPANS